MNSFWFVVLYVLLHYILFSVLMISVAYKRHKKYKVNLLRKEAFKLIKGEKVEKNLRD